MLNWFAGVFSDTSDQARLISVLVTGGIAIAALLLNQYFVTRRTRKELLIKKIEEAYQATLAYEKNAWSLLKDIQIGRRDEHGNFNPDYSLIDAVNEEVERLAMLFGLYFPEVGFDKDKYYAGPTLPVMEAVFKGKAMTETEHIVISHGTKDNIKSHAAELRKFCSELMTQYRH
ncbi:MULTISPECIES: hypothetical protein [Marinobacter]|uniref:hypothetical protein n=1 Tax=Marinobacter TaxID=2742 RepID=UPI000774388F|nr:hypothetical protein [Marinobacter excellens]